MKRVLPRGGLILSIVLLVCGCTTAPSAKQVTAKQGFEASAQQDKDQAIAAVKAAKEAVGLLHHQIEAEELEEKAKGYLHRAKSELQRARVALEAGDYATARHTVWQCYNGLIFSSGISKDDPSRFNLYYRVPAGPLI